jgi:diguanylate cyclase (GGDEF)-like protein
VIGFLLGKLILSYGKKEEKLRDLALIDGLTKLYNRKGFISFASQILQHADRAKKGLLLVFVDLNNMKWINDKFGHTEGDRTLSCVAQTLRDTFRHSDIISRIGGDEFAILALDAKQEDIEVVRKRLAENLKTVECNISAEYRPSLSSGIVYYDPDNPCSIEDLLNRADTLMYEEKRKNNDQNK